MDEQRKQLLKLLKLFDDNGCSKHLVLIGSWAEYMYMVTGILPDYEAAIRTLDIDFLIKNLKRPVPPVNIAALAQEQGFYIEEDRLTGITKLLSKNGLEVEFLIAQKGSGESPALKTNLGVTAQALRHLDLLKTNSIEAEYLGIKVNVPLPEAFVLHKMIINDERKDKMEKDRIVINRMYKHLNIPVFNDLCKALTKKEQTAVKNYMDEIIIPMAEKEKALALAKMHLE